MTTGSLPFYLLILITLIVFYVSKDMKFKQWILLLASLVFASYYSITSVVTVTLMSILNFYYAKYAIKGGNYTYTKLVVINTINIASLLLLRKLIDLGFNSLTTFSQGFSNTSIVILGIGFYTLQNVAYQIDVYKKRFAPETNLVGYILANAFFARVTMGPVMNIQAFNKQLATLPVKFTEENFTLGVQRILIGSIKKLVIAERLTFTVNYLFDDPHGSQHGYSVLVAGLLFTVQLYFDFSGYIDIALGTSRLFGIQLKENFNMPFRSTSISEWWRRWHITLIEWFTQYIYYPLAYKLRHARTTATLVAIACTFFVSALWHGLGITYIIWGLCHITYLIAETLLKKQTMALQKKTNPALYAMIFTPITIALVCFSHLFFRSADLSHATRMIYVLFDFKNFWPDISFSQWLMNGGDDFETSFNLRFGVFLAILYLVFEKRILNTYSFGRYRVAWFTFLTVVLVMLGVFDGASRFIYMQF